jgi:hypothetical protein
MKLHRPSFGAFLIMVLSSAGFAADKIGSVFIGADYLPDNKYDETRSGVYRLQKVGFAGGFYLPLNLPVVDAHFKLKASVHGIEARAWDRAGTRGKDDAALYDRHAAALNEILIGKEIATGGTSSFLPQLGFGLQMDALDQDGDSSVGGIVYSAFFSDISGRLRYRWGRFGLEAILNYQYCLVPSWSGYEATDRLAVSLAVFK